MCQTHKYTYAYNTTVNKTIQELSYCKQIVRQLRTQCVEGIYRSNCP